MAVAPLRRLSAPATPSHARLPSRCPILRTRFSVCAFGASRWFVQSHALPLSRQRHHVVHQVSSSLHLQCPFGGKCSQTGCYQRPRRHVMHPFGLRAAPTWMPSLAFWPSSARYSTRHGAAPAGPVLTAPASAGRIVSQALVLSPSSVISQAFTPHPVGPATFCGDSCPSRCCLGRSNPRRRCWSWPRDPGWNW